MFPGLGVSRSVEGTR